MAESKYHFVDGADGFTIMATGRVASRATCWRAWWSVDGEGQQRRLFGLVEYYRLSRAIAETLMATWTPKAGTSWDARRWAVTQTAGAIGKRAHQRWQALIQEADPTVLAVQRRVFSVTLGCSALLMEPDLYKRRWLVHDILKYRAAAIAARHGVDLVDGRAERRAGQAIQGDIDALQRKAEALGMTLTVHATGAYVNNESAVDGLEAWPDLFSPDGQAYPSLNKTLMQLPGGIPSKLLCDQLPRLRLVRPYSERLELLALLCYGRHIHARGRPVSHDHVFEHATTDELRRAVARVGDHLRTELSHRRSSDVLAAVGVIADYPDLHHGRVCGLADKAIRWHRHEAGRRAEQEAKRLGADTPTARPRSLPEVPGIKFLATVGDVCREGAELDHCVGSYAREAVSGRCYLFAVEHQGERATVEVAPDGTVRQAHGPQNRRNRAAEFGRRRLASWSREADLGDPEVADLAALGIDLEVNDERIPF